MDKRKKWAAEEEEFLRKNYESFTDEEIAGRLNKVRDVVKKKRQRMGLEKVRGRKPDQ